MTFLISIILIILLHELGHLLAARAVGCGVDTFSIGFGRSIFSFRYKKTTYKICWLLLGGYTKVKKELVPSRAKDAFSNLPYRKKVILITAGCIMNILTGVIAILLGMSFRNFSFVYFGCLSTLMGIFNLIPIAPCLDGGYLTYLPIFLKLFGKKKGWKVFAKASRISFAIIMAINIACIPWLIYLILIGRL